MAVRSFEEQVRAELGALRLKPDEQVWLHVEAALQKEKKRRWLIWLFAGLLAGGALGGYYYRSTNNHPVAIIVPAKTMHQQQPVKENPLKNTGRGKVLQENRTPAPSGTEQGTQKNEIFDDRSNTKIGKSAVAISSFNKKGEKTAERQSYSLQNNLDPVKPAISVSAINNYPEHPVKQQAIADDQKNAVSLPVNTDSLPASETVTSKEQSKVISTDTLSENKRGNAVMQPSDKKKKKNPWRLFGLADMGSSTEKGNTVLPSFANNNNSSPPNGIPGSISGAYNGSNSIYQQPVRSAGFSFGLGLQAVKPIAKNTEIGLGLAYQFYQTGISVGRKLQDSVANMHEKGYYYLSTDSIRYNNNWHFAELSVDLYQRFSLGGTTVLRWRVGLGTTVLLASNALYFDPNNRVLYEQSAIRNKWQFNISTGLDFGIGKQQAFFIGPQFTYFLTPSNSADSYRFLRAGLRASVAIPKRKK